MRVKISKERGKERKGRRVSVYTRHLVTVTLFFSHKRLTIYYQYLPRKQGPLKPEIQELSTNRLSNAKSDTNPQVKTTSQHVNGKRGNFNTKGKDRWEQQKSHV